MEEYIREFMHKLNCSNKKKNEISKELRADIQSAIENGETWEEIRKRMGSPEEIAQEFNDNFSESKSNNEKGKKSIVIVGAVLAVIVVAGIIIWAVFSNKTSPDSVEKSLKNNESEVNNEAGVLGQNFSNKGDGSQEDASFENGNLQGNISSDENSLQQNNSSAQIVQGNFQYDEEKVVERCKLIISLIDKGDYDTLRREYTAKIMEDMVESSQIEAAKKVIGDDWGNLVSYGDFYTEAVQQMGEDFVLIQVNVSYEKENVTYTITLDTDLKLAGMYMK